MDIAITIILIVAYLLRPQEAINGFKKGIKEGLKN